MIKKISLLSALSATAFSGWAQEPAATGEDSEPMVVTANRVSQPISSVLAPMDVVTKEDIDRWQAKSLSDVMRRLPGVDIAQNGGRGQSASIYIRGTESRHTLVLIDGVRLAKPGVMGVADYNQIPISIVQRIEYVRGARSAVYGADAIGGVINIITRSDEDYAKLEAGIGSDSYQLYDGAVRQHLGDSTVVSLASAYESTNGYNIQPSLTNPLDRDRDGFRSKSFWGSIEQQFTSQLSGFARGRGYTNNAEYDGRYGDERQLYNTDYDIGLNFAEGAFSSQIIGSYQKYKDYNYDSAKGRYASGASLDNMAQRNLQWGNTYQFEHGMVSGGVDWLQERLVSSDSTQSDSYKRDNTGVYLTGQQKINDVTLEGAFRADKNEQFGWHETGQAAIGWEFIPDYKATLSYGTGYQAPTLGQLYGLSRLYISSNRDLKPEESKQWELGLEGLTGPVNWRMSAYRNKVTNLIGYASDPITWEGGYINIESATLKGIEWHASFDTGIFTHGITLEYLDARRDKDDEVLARRSKQKAKYQLDWNMWGLDMDVSYQYNSKRYDNNTSEYSSTQRRLPSYSTVDISASYPITTDLTVRGRIANLLDKDYETAYGYQTAGREYFLTASYSFK